MIDHFFSGLISPNGRQRKYHQSFRIRSGRSKQQKRKSKHTAAPAAGDAQSQSALKPPTDDVPKPTSSHEEPKADPEHSGEIEPEKEEANGKQKSEGEDTGHNGDQPLNTSRDSNGDTSLQNASQGVADEKEPSNERSVHDLSSHDLSRRMTDPQQRSEPSSEAEDFDLNPPKPRAKPPSLETLSELLFSSGHLDALLHHPPQLARFSAFLQKYIPHHYPLLAQYLETQKAIKAIAYANAIAEGLKPQDTGRGTTTETRRRAATLDSEFEAISNASFRALVGDALPNFVSYSLVKTASECLINEITGRSTPVMRDMVGGLSEVFCLTDPNQEDNPIIYASEEFYRLTRYGPDDVLNHNCRFLQGRKTNPESPKRLRDAILKGEEISETLLNYRRDGRPFINLLMVAPLHDRHGKLKYHIGAQIDVTGLVEGGRALEGFQRYLNRRAEAQKQEELEKDRQNLKDDQEMKKRTLARLRDLSESFDLEESAVVQSNSRLNSLTHDDDDNRSIGSTEKLPRRVYGDSEGSDVEDEDGALDRDNTEDWKLGEAGDGRPSGKLPGVYDSFMLLRPAPSLRIVFVSPKLRRIGNVLQTPFLSHVAAPSSTITGLAESLKTGVPVSAKIHFTPERGQNRDGTILRNGTKHEDGKNGKAIWVSCTPLVGDDESIGVWMCVVVEKSKVGAASRRHAVVAEKSADEPVRSIEALQTDTTLQSRAGARKSREIAEKPSDHPNGASDQNGKRHSEDAPIKPVRIDSNTVFTKKEEFEKASTPEQNRSAKSIRPMESIYFDAEGGQEPMNPKLDQPNEEQQRQIHEAAVTNDHFSPQRQGPPVRDPRAVVTPVEEYEEVPKDLKAYNVEVPGLSSSPTNNTGDEYVATRSHSTHSPQNGRVLIEDDSDTCADDAMNHHRENMEVGSPQRERLRSSRSQSPVWSPASDITPSVPSSAQLPDEHEDDSRNQINTPSRGHDDSHFLPERSNEGYEYIDDHENLDDSQATLRDHRRDQDEDQDRDSAIQMEAPEKNGAKSQTPPQDSSPSLSPAKQARDIEEDGYAEFEDLQGHKLDVQNWVEDARPPSSKQNQNARINMDYLIAGSNRWSPGPRLGKDAMGQADEDRMTDFDHCVRSPYSVD